MATLLCVIVFSSWVYAEEHNIQKEPPILEKPSTPAFPTPRFQRPHGTVFQMNKRLTCNDTDVVENAMENVYKEIPITMGLVRNQMGVATMATIVYVNPKTRAYSIVEHSISGISCILTSGYEFNYHYDYDIFDQGSREH